MAKNFKSMIAAILATLMLSTATLPVLANAIQPTTNWLGDNVELNIETGDDSYTYMLFGDIPNYYYYETSNHTLKKEVTGGGAVHLIALIDTKTYSGKWTPNGIYSFGESNYDVVYCCDAATGSEAGDYYKRLNLEDSEYYSDEQAEKLRAIIMNSYPYVSVEEAKAALKEAGFEQADQLDRSELISATQAAVWSIANKNSGDSYAYNKTATTAQKNTWGGYLHDFSAEITNFTDSTTSKKYITPAGVGDRIDALRDFLLNLAPVKAEDDQIVITNLDIVNSKIFGTEDQYEVTLNIELNHSVDANDDIVINAYVGDKIVSSLKAGEGKYYSMKLKASENDDIKVVVSGTQKLEKGVYFYAPKPADVDGDGIATSREVSQNLIGVSGGDTPVYAEAVATINDGKIIDKDATKIYEDKYTDVTLSVIGNVEYNSGEKLPVDIIYILGNFLSVEEVKADTMIKALTETFRDLINKGVPVNFGIVPFSSTKDPVLPFVSLTTEADLEKLPETIAAAIKEAGNVYDAVNMENALLTATEMFSASDLGKMDRTDRQHLVMISSGHTYYFNSGENNEYISTVPVRFTKGNVDTNEIFYMEKAWMRARNNSTNSYPIPKAITEYYNANTDKYASEWDCYWSLIDAWAKADIAAGDTIVYNATTRAAADFIKWFNSGKYSSNSNIFTYSGHGAVISNPDLSVIENILKFDMDDGGTNYGPNPFVHEYAAHAISYERAMWEAYTFLQDNITGKGINFYPVYNPLRANGTASNGSHYDYTWTTNYIGHCFMNMLAGGEAIFFDANNVTFFDDIKAEIVGASGSSTGVTTTPFVEDFIGTGEDFDFDFTSNLDKLVLKVNGVAYATAKLEAAMNGADATFTFTAPGAEKATFVVDYFKGNGTTEERFVWYFLESIDEESEVTLTYQLELVKRNEEVGTHVAQTNQVAVLYPNGDRSYGQLFPVPEVTYTIPQKNMSVSFESGTASNISFMLIDKATGKVSFLNKIDIGGETSFEIPYEEGKISAIFIKQSTSGMFWFAEEVDEATQQAVIDCLKANNPSYKGHNAVAFGGGEHELEFKNNKFVTYTFAAEDVVIKEETVIIPEEPTVEIPEIEVPEVDSSKKEETTVKNNGNGNGNGNGNNKNKNKNK